MWIFISGVVCATTNEVDIQLWGVYLEYVRLCLSGGVSSGRVCHQPRLILFMDLHQKASEGNMNQLHLELMVYQICSQECGSSPCIMTLMMPLIERANVAIHIMHIIYFRYILSLITFPMANSTRPHHHKYHTPAISIYLSISAVAKSCSQRSRKSKSCWQKFCSCYLTT